LTFNPGNYPGQLSCNVLCLHNVNFDQMHFARAELSNSKKQQSQPRVNSPDPGGCFMGSYPEFSGQHRSEQKRVAFILL